MADTIGNTFSVGGTGSTAGTYTAPQSVHDAGDGAGDRQWWEVALGAGLSVFDQLTYTSQEQARDELAEAQIEAQREATQAQQQTAQLVAQQQAQSQQTMMYAVAGVGALVVLVLVMK